MKKYAIIFMLVGAGQTKAAQMALITDVQKLSNEVTQNITKAETALKNLQQNTSIQGVVNQLLKQTTNVTNTKQQFLQSLQANAVNPAAITQIKGSMDKLKTQSENINSKIEKLNNSATEITSLQDQLNKIGDPQLSSIGTILQSGSIPQSAILTQLIEKHNDLVKQWNDLKKTSQSFSTITSLDELDAAVTTFKDSISQLDTNVTNLESDVEKLKGKSTQNSIPAISTILTTSTMSYSAPQASLITSGTSAMQNSVNATINKLRHNLNNILKPKLNRIYNNLVNQSSHSAEGYDALINQYDTIKKNIESLGDLQDDDAKNIDSIKIKIKEISDSITKLDDSIKKFIAKNPQLTLDQAYEKLKALKESVSKKPFQSIKYQMLIQEYEQLKKRGIPQDWIDKFIDKVEEFSNEVKKS